MQANSTRKQENKLKKIIPKSTVGSVSQHIELDDFANRFIAQFDKVFRKDFLIEKNNKIVLAVSGGVDSVAMLDCFAIIAPKFGLNLAVAHINHKLRGIDSDLDEELVKNLAEKYGLPFFTQAIDVKELAQKTCQSIETTARNVRYDFLKKVAQSFDANYIATAHTCDDQAETILINLIKGTGIRGLRGIAKIIQINKNLYLIRPLLSFPKSTLIEYAKHRNLQWREDKSNFSLDYFRNKIRHELLPLIKKNYNPNIVELLVKTSELAQAYHNYIKPIVEHILKESTKIISPNEIRIEIPKVVNYEPFLVGELIQEVFTSFLKKPPISFQKIENIRKLFHAQTGKVQQILSNLIAYKDREYIYLIDKSTKQIQILADVPKLGRYLWNSSTLIILEEVEKDDFELNENPNIEYFDYDKIQERITIRSWETGDRFVPLGMKKSIKLSDFFVNQKVPKHLKERIPVLVSRGEIFWVGGYRISEKYKVTRKSKRIIRGRIIKIEQNDGN